MYTRILVALDGSQLSECILPYARSFAKAFNIPVELLEVIDLDTLMPSVVAQHGRYHDVMTAEREKRSAYLKEVATLFSGSLPVDCSVKIGKPAEIIVDTAAADAGTLIAMATHGRSGVKRWLLGSVADKVLHAAPNHLLLVRTTERTQGIERALLERVMVPLDGSGLAESVIPHAVDLAKKMNLEIVLLRAYALPTPVYASEGYAPDLGELWEQIRKESQQYLDEMARKLRGEGLDRVSTVVLEGNAAEKIIDVAHKSPKSLVAMSTHGRTGVGRWVLGSVTDRVVRHSDDPVLVIRASS